MEMGVSRPKSLWLAALVALWVDKYEVGHNYKMSMLVTFESWVWGNFCPRWRSWHKSACLVTWANELREVGTDKTEGPRVLRLAPIGW